MLIDKCRSLRDYVKIKRRVYIYGAGFWGNLVADVLDDVSSKLEGFIVSDSELITESKYKIIKFSELQYLIDGRSDVGIIIAVKKVSTNEIEANLIKAGIKDYYVIKERDIGYKTVGVLDTSVSDNNHGNQIIMESVHQHLRGCINNAFIIDYPCWDDFGQNMLDSASNCNYFITGGTNLISGQFEKEKYIGINENNIELFENKIILLGAGLTHETEEISEYSKDIYRKILKKNAYHSVRNSLTQKVLNDIGIQRVINTGCPTIWSLSEQKCQNIPQEKSENVLIMVSTWNHQKEKTISSLIREYYNKVFLWVQQPQDYFFAKLYYPDIEVIGTNLWELDAFLSKSDVDYVGSRLHGGIRCMQFGHRSIIIPVDHRAKQMGIDFNLPVADSYEKLESMISKPFKTSVILRSELIKQWKYQFRDLD